MGALSVQAAERGFVGEGGVELRWGGGEGAMQRRQDRGGRSVERLWRQQRGASRRERRSRQAVRPYPGLSIFPFHKH